MNDFEEHGQVVLGLTIICLTFSRVRTQHAFAQSTTKVRNANVCGTVSSMLSGLKTRSLGLNTLGTT